MNSKRRKEVLLEAARKRRVREILARIIHDLGTTGDCVSVNEKVGGVEVIYDEPRTLKITSFVPYVPKKIKVS
jgi:hypothetical protein